MITKQEEYAKLMESLHALLDNESPSCIIEMETKIDAFMKKHEVGKYTNRTKDLTREEAAKIIYEEADMLASNIYMFEKIHLSILDDYPTINPIINSFCYGLTDMEDNELLEAPEEETY